MNAEKGKHRQENHQRRNQLHHAHTRLPSPPLMPSALPCLAFGKKKLMFPMLEAKLAPAKPHSSAMMIKTQ